MGGLTEILNPLAEFSTVLEAPSVEQSIQPDAPPKFTLPQPDERYGKRSCLGCFSLRFHLSIRFGFMSNFTLINYFVLLKMLLTCLIISDTHNPT